MFGHLGTDFGYCASYLTLTADRLRCSRDYRAVSACSIFSCVFTLKNFLRSDHPLVSTWGEFSVRPVVGLQKPIDRALANYSDGSWSRTVS
jgi:hypothetical protein